MHSIYITVRYTISYINPTMTSVMMTDLYSLHPQPVFISFLPPFPVKVIVLCSVKIDNKSFIESVFFWCNLGIGAWCWSLKPSF